MKGESFINVICFGDGKGFVVVKSGVSLTSW